jgi:hypothetical protein
VLGSPVEPITAEQNKSEVLPNTTENGILQSMCTPLKMLHYQDMEHFAVQKSTKTLKNIVLNTSRIWNQWPKMLNMFIMCTIWKFVYTVF